MSVRFLRRLCAWCVRAKRNNNSLPSSPPGGFQSRLVAGVGMVTVNYPTVAVEKKGTEG